MNLTTNIIQEDISDLIGLNSLSEDEKIAMLRDLGELVLESAIIRLTADMSDEQVKALDQYSDTVTDSQVLLNHLFQHYKNFETILQEEIVAFKEEALAVMGSK